MKINAMLRLIAGLMVILSLVLAKFVAVEWIYFTVFIALNLIQSAFTNWCPMMTFLRKLGVED